MFVKKCIIFCGFYCHDRYIAKLDQKCTFGRQDEYSEKLSPGISGKFRFKSLTLSKSFPQTVSIQILFGFLLSPPPYLTAQWASPLKVNAKSKLRKHKIVALD